MNDWLTYHWPLHERIATFRVDRSASGRLAALGDNRVLIHVTCVRKQAMAAAFSVWERRRLSLFQSRCAGALGEGGVYAGSVEVGEETRLFYYAADARFLVPVYNLCTLERSLLVTCAKADEPGAETYYRFLLPDAAKLSGMENERLIAERKKRGEDLAAYRRISFSFSFSTADAAAAFCLSAREAGFALGGGNVLPEREYPHASVLYAVSDLDWARLTDLSARAIRLAEAVGGRFEGMEAGVVEKKR